MHFLPFYTIRLFVLFKQSVLQQTTGVNKDGDILTSIQREYSMANRIPIQQQSLSCNSDRKKQGVSAESSESTGQASDITITKYEKDFRCSRTYLIVFVGKQ